METTETWERQRGYENGTVTQRWARADREKQAEREVREATAREQVIAASLFGVAAMACHALLECAGWPR